MRKSAVSVVLLFSALVCRVYAGDKSKYADQPVKVAGILIEKDKDWLTVKADGEDEPVKYAVDPSNEALQESFKGVFNASRVQLTYKQAGDKRQLVTIKRHLIKATGTMTGEVVKVYNDFWVEVKPKRGVHDAFAPGANYNDKAFMKRLRELQPGDSVTITYYTDFERHRIKTLRKNARKKTEDGMNDRRWLGQSVTMPRSGKRGGVADGLRLCVLICLPSIVLPIRCRKSVA